MLEQSTPRPWYDTPLARWLAVAVWMGLIFALSAQPHLPSVPNGLLDLLFKKGAHFSAYALLGALFWRALGWRWRAWGWAWVLAVLYACTDEWHQSFVAGRHPAVADVIIDACGAATALLIAWSSRRRTTKDEGRRTT
jgi:VanZ family protein